MMPKRYQLKPRLLTAEKEGLFYVLDIEPGRVHTFNDSARMVFQLCLEPRTEADIVEAFARTFDLEPAAAEEDVRLVLRHLEALDLLQKPTDA